MRVVKEDANIKNDVAALGSRTPATYRIPVHRDDARVRAEPFDAFELELSTPWAR
jgi:hypothetical protein